MEITIPPRDHGKTAQRYTWDENGAVEKVEPLDRIPENFEHNSTRGGIRRDGRQTVAWPFHRHTASEVPSTPMTSVFRRATWQPKSFFRAGDDTASVSTRSIIPDYVINYLRGETPETLAKKRERQNWGARTVEVRPQRDTIYSRVVDIEDDAFATTPNYTGLSSAYANEDPQRGLRRLMTGWRGGVTYNTLLSSIMLFVCALCLILVATKAQAILGETTVYSGSCATASSVNTGIHVLINVFSVILVAGANYTYHVLSSPTRLEVAAAHHQKQWLDIGVPSLRNLKHTSTFRSILAVSFLLTAIASQIIYNALIFTSRKAFDTDASGSESCSVSIDRLLLLIVSVLNLVTVLRLVAVQAMPTFEPLVTLGDALRSFLRNSDPTTSGSCLLSKDDVNKGFWGQKEVKFLVANEQFWFSAVSTRRWVLTILSWLALVAPTAAGVGLTLSSDTAAKLTSFGTTTQTGIVRHPLSISPALVAVIAALPQLLLALLYLATNGLLTTYFLSHEFSLFALSPRPLRVSSDPVGAQTTSLFLTLPRPVSWVLLALFATMGLVLSQTVFPAVDANGSEYTSAIAISPLALLVFLALLALLALVVLGLGFRRSPSTGLVHGNVNGKGNPLVLRGGSCSAVLSARCHYTAAFTEPWRKEVQWGSMNGVTEMSVGRYGFRAPDIKEG